MVNAGLTGPNRACIAFSRMLGTGDEAERRLRDSIRPSHLEGRKRGTRRPRGGVARYGPRRRVRTCGRDRPRGARARDRHRHGQVRPRGAQDRRHPRLYRSAGDLRACRRGEPRRSRHGSERRRRARAVDVGRDDRTRRDRHLRQTFRDSLVCDDGEAGERPRAPGRHLPRAPRRGGGLPQRARPDDLDDDATRARRRTRDGALGGQGLYGARLRRVSSWRQAGRQARPCPRRHAYGRSRSADPDRREDGRGDRRNVVQGFRLRRRVRPRGRGSPASSPTAISGGTSNRTS